MTSKPLKIGLAGLGTVGTGVITILNQHRDSLIQKCGRSLQITVVSARNKGKDRGVDLSKYKWVDTPEQLAQEDVDVVVELMGGAEGSAKNLVEASLKSGKSVVTANKALLAHHGVSLAKLTSPQAHLYFEAAVAGGIPIIKMLREGLAANDLTSVLGILNGTCNYILTTMEKTGRDFADVLSEAQAKGYAEADPTFDIDGMDTGHKLCLLASLAFGIAPDLDNLPVSGIRRIKATDIDYAKEFGYRIKLLGIAQKHKNGDVEQGVEACLVPISKSLAGVDGVFNAVNVIGDHVGSCLIEGRGAGAGPTASAVVADLMDCARGHHVSPFSVPLENLAKPKWRNPRDSEGEFYLRLNVLDQPGVIADVAAILRDHKISIEGLIQRGRDPGQPVAVIMTTHTTKRGDIEDACTKIGSLKSVQDQPVILRRLSIA